MKAKCRRMRSNKRKKAGKFSAELPPRSRRDKFPFYQSSCCSAMWKLLLKMFSNFKSQNDCYGLAVVTRHFAVDSRDDKRVKSVSQAEETCRRWRKQQLEKWKDINYESKMKMFSRVWADIHCDITKLQQRHAKGWQRSFKFIVSPSQIKCATTVKLVGRVGGGGSCHGRWEFAQVGKTLNLLFIHERFHAQLWGIWRDHWDHPNWCLLTSTSTFQHQKALKRELESSWQHCTARAAHSLN